MDCAVTNCEEPAKYRIRFLGVKAAYHYCHRHTYPRSNKRTAWQSGKYHQRGVGVSRI